MWEVVSRCDHEPNSPDTVSIIAIVTPLRAVGSASSGPMVVLLETISPPSQARVLEWPGGLVDYGETIEQAAERELLAQTGLVGRAAGCSSLAYTAPYMTNETFQTVVMQVDPNLAGNSELLAGMRGEPGTAAGGSGGSSGISVPVDDDSASEDGGSEDGEEKPSEPAATFSTVLVAPLSGLLGCMLAWRTSTIARQAAPGTGVQPACGIDAKLLSFAQGIEAASLLGGASRGQFGYSGLGASAAAPPQLPSSIPPSKA